MALVIHTAAAIVSGDRYVIAEDWPSADLAAMAATTAAVLLRGGSGYAGGKNRDAITEYVAGLLEVTVGGHACGLLYADVVDD